MFSCILNLHSNQSVILKMHSWNILACKRFFYNISCGKNRLALEKEMSSQLIYGVKKRKKLREESFAIGLLNVKAVVGFRFSQQASNVSSPAMIGRVAVKKATTEA